MSTHPTIAESDAVDDDALDPARAPPGMELRSKCCEAQRRIVNVDGHLTTECCQCDRQNPGRTLVRVDD